MFHADSSDLSMSAKVVMSAGTAKEGPEGDPSTGGDGVEDSVTGSSLKAGVVEEDWALNRASSCSNL